MSTDFSVKTVGPTQFCTNTFKSRSGIHYQSLLLIITVFLVTIIFPPSTYNIWNVCTKNVFKQRLASVGVA